MIDMFFTVHSLRRKHPGIVANYVSCIAIIGPSIIERVTKIVLEYSAVLSHEYLEYSSTLLSTQVLEYLFQL